MNDPQVKRITIVFPIELWRELRQAQTDGKIDSIQQAAVDGCCLLLENLERK